MMNERPSVDIESPLGHDLFWIRSFQHCHTLQDLRQLGPATATKAFVEFSPHQDRASLMSSVGSGIGASSSLGRRRRRPPSASAGARSGRRRRNTRVTKVRVINGRVSLRVGGFPGVQRVGASQLVRFVPLNKLRAAAKRVLGRSSLGRRKRGRKGRKRRRVRRQ